MNEQELFAKATAIDSADARSEFLDAECQGDPKLKSRIERLLKLHEGAGSFLNHPVVDGVATALLADTDDAGSRTVPHVDDIPLDFLEPARQQGSLGRMGQYDILEAVGRGGMGIVLKAHDAKLNRVVAVKVLAPELASNPTARKRFSREAQAGAAVSHDHVVTIYAVEDSAGNEALPYLVMEFIDGESLQEKIDRQGNLEIREILRIGTQIAAGLAAAHGQGLIHRDVKPANILLQNGVQRVQITDFGLARAVDDVGMTRTGDVTGTPQYMSPEQAQGHPVDVRSDLFSLGSVLYAMCTGRSPFRADTSVAALRRVCDDTPRPIREINSDTPQWLIAIIDRLLEKDAGDRFQTSEEVSELLGRHLAHIQDPGSTPFPGTMRPLRRDRSSRPGWNNQRWLVTGLVVLAVTVCLGVTDATGVTNVTEYVATVLRIQTPQGTLILEIDDPDVSVVVEGNGQQLSIMGAGIERLELRPGNYQLRATRDGEPVPIDQELVTVTRGGNRVVRISLEGHEPIDEREEGRRFDAVGEDHLSQAVALKDRGRLDEAAAKFSLALSLVPEGLEGDRTRAAILHEIWPDEGMYQRVMDLRPDDIGLWYWRGLLFRSDERWTDAVESFRKAFEFGPAGAGGWLDYAFAVLATGDIEAYRDVCEEILMTFSLVNNPSEAWFAAWAMVAIPDAIEDRQSAFALAERAYVEDPENVRFQKMYAMWLYRTDRLEEAISVIDQLPEASLRPRAENADIAYFAAMARHRLGDAEEARSWSDLAARRTANAEAGRFDVNHRVFARRLTEEMHQVLASAADRPETAEEDGVDVPPAPPSADRARNLEEN